MADHNVPLPRDTEGIVLLAFGGLVKMYDGVVIRCMIVEKQWSGENSTLFKVSSGYGRWRVSSYELAECRIKIFHARCQGASCPTPRNVPDRVIYVTIIPIFHVSVQ